MKRKNTVVLYLLAILIIILSGCSNNKIKYTTNEGDFEKTNSEAITREYNRKLTDSFFVSLDFDLKEGKLDWDIVNPNGKTLYKGYIINENGKLYGQLTSPQEPSITESFYKKEEINRKPTYSILPIMESFAGSYKIILKPTNARGKYTVKWASQLPSS